jgi:GNAT superfamily N-acetyltransferase
MSIKIVSFNKDYAPAFKSLNIEWLETFFYVEPYDLEILSNPITYVINPGGQIFFALDNDQVVGTVALFKADDNLFELTKMAVLPTERGKNIGQMLLQHCLDFAKNNKVGLFLYSHTKLANAIYIYKKYGFVQVPLNPDNPYQRSDIKMVLNPDTP